MSNLAGNDHNLMTQEFIQPKPTLNIAIEMSLNILNPLAGRQTVPTLGLFYLVKARKQCFQRKKRTTEREDSGVLIHSEFTFKNALKE